MSRRPEASDADAAAISEPSFAVALDATRITATFFAGSRDREAASSYCGARRRVRAQTTVMVTHEPRAAAIADRILFSSPTG